MKSLTFIIPTLVIILIGGYFLFFNEKESELEKVKVAEVTHSVFYAPQYVAHSLGYFEDEGLDVELLLVPGADKVAAAVLSGDVNIGFCGTEATIYVYQQGEEDYLVTFAGLTKRDGSFLVSRTKYENFKLEDLKGKDIIGGRKGGMPEMTFEWALRANGIDPVHDVNIDTSIAFPAMGGAFIGGLGDFVTLFEPNALKIEQEGYGYVVASIGELGGVVPYTAYNAKKSYIKNNPEVIEGFTKAIQKGLDYVHNNDAKTVAEAIIEYFPDTSMNDLIKIVDRYQKIDSWFSTTFIEEENFEHVQAIMKSAKELTDSAPYDKLINNTYSKK